MYDTFYIRRIWSFSKALDLALVDEELEKGFNIQLGKRHGERVAYISLCLGRTLNLKGDDLIILLTAGLLHDIGAVGGFRMVHGNGQLITEHCQLGASLVRNFPSGKLLADIILAHHETPNSKFALLKLDQASIPLAAKIISLADHLDVYMAHSLGCYNDREKIRHWIKENSGSIFFPEIVEAFIKLSDKEAFWLDLEQHNLMEIALELVYNNIFNHSLELHNFAEYQDEIESKVFTYSLAETFAHLIDQKSRFTARHSQGVANNVKAIAAKLEWEEERLSQIYLAGLLHDIGKLAVPSKILDKPGALEPEEFAVIRSHTYYTSRLLTEAGFPKSLVGWAAHHHENLDGTGYPFALREDRLDEGAKIMTIADMFTALTEDRPYREGLSPTKAFEIIGRGIGGKVDVELYRVAREALL